MAFSFGLEWARMPSAFWIAFSGTRANRPRRAHVARCRGRVSPTRASLSRREARSARKMSESTFETMPTETMLSRRNWMLGAAAAGLTCAGCPSSSRQDVPSAVPEGQPPLRLAVIDDSSLADAILRQWKARADADLEVVKLTRAEVADRKTLSTDGVIYPCGLLGELIEKNWLSPIDGESLVGHALARTEIYELSRLRETNWGDDVYGVPFGSAVLTLAYRTDLIPEAPATWSEYAAAAALATNGDSAVSGALEPLGGRWAAEVFLARAAAYARRRDAMASLFDFKSMAAILATPPFERALNELVAIAKKSPVCLEMTPPDTAAAIFDGRCGMTLTWLNGQTMPPETTVPVAFAEAPGAREVFDQRKQKWKVRPSSIPGRVTLLGVAGRMGSVTRLSSHPREAARALSLLSSADWSRRISPESTATAPFRSAHSAHTAAWAQHVDPVCADSYGEAVEASLRRADWVFSPRIPGRDDYLRSLAEGVRAAVGGVGSSEALSQVCSDWDEITAGKGLESQRKAYKDSLVR